jgi:hypothetical protein
MIIAETDVAAISIRLMAGACFKEKPAKIKIGTNRIPPPIPIREERAEITKKTDARINMYSICEFSSE